MRKIEIGGPMGRGKRSRQGCRHEIKIQKAEKREERERLENGQKRNETG
jgi:hypothetical protein